MNCTLTINELAPSLNGDKGLMRMHYRDLAKVKEGWRRQVIGERNKLSFGFPLLVPCTIQINRYYASRPLDIDNLYAACKVPIDALVKAEVLPDDNPDCVTDLRCRQFKVPHKVEQQTEIILSWEIKITVP